MSAGHVIQDLQFDVEFGTIEQAFEMQARLSAFACGPALQVVEQVFDAVGGDSGVLQLELLEVDLGVVEPDDLERQLDARLREQLLRLLAEKASADVAPGSSRQPQDVRRVTVQQVELEALIHFLRWGVLPWHKAAETDPVELAQRVVQRDPQALMCQLRELPDPQVVARRVARQLPASWAERLTPAAHDAGLADRRAGELGRVAVAAVDQSLPDEPLFITNAGVVLLAAFLERLFRLLGLIDEGAFVHTEAAERAVAVVQYAITGQAVAPETLLPLNKLLCGLAPHIPVPRAVLLTRAECEAVDGMLAAAISGWTILGQTSAAGLRIAFLQREGRLEYRAQAWQLEVENKAHDLLMDQLPWGYSTIHFPWMPGTIHVEWR